MNKKIVFKKLEPDEMDLAKELILMFGFDTENGSLPGDDYVSKMLSGNDFHVIVALENNLLIGGVTAYEMKMFKRETTEMFLYEIEVRESHRQKGIGTGLINFLKAICDQKGIVEMFVGTEKGNLPARKLYSSTGGKPDDGSVWFSYKF